MAELYPLRFQPVFRRYIWGGDRLRTVLGKNTGDEMCAESWEVVDHGDDQSVVLAGPLAGVSLGELVREHGAALLGRHHPQPRFPLLAKFLDAHRTLSVQVHPNDAQAARLDPPDLGKTEAWLVMDVEPGSVVYAGLKQGFDRPAFEREMNRGTAELCLNSFEPAVGQCVFIPAGLVHALGEGLLIFEIQQSSDTTYRLFDWNRLQADGTPRELHIEAGLDATDFSLGPVGPQQPQPTDASGRTRLVECDKFVFDRYEFPPASEGDAPLSIGGDDRFHLLAVIAGSCRIAGDPVDVPLTKGSTALLPASCGPTIVEPLSRGTLVDVYLP
ncbi:MAG: class I mannose-6-phosphate isomerase [Planctomycetales bacterium]|nr:class I mannose-6-phosphate isomerase [Planctomycetales bacterium]